MSVQIEKISKLLAVGFAAMLLNGVTADFAVSAPLKRGSTGPTSQPPKPPPQSKEVKQEESGGYVYRDTRMIRLPIVPPFPIF
jgi:hypothetical protein